MGKRAAKPTNNNNNSNPNPAKRPNSASIILSGPEISNESNNHQNNNYSSDEVVSSSELSFSSSTIPSAQHQNHLGLKKVASTNQPVLGENNTTVVVNRVVSSNPTLNLLLSTPIKTTATGKGTTTPGGNNSNRSKKASTKTNAKTKVTSAIGGTKTSCGSAKSSSIIGGDITATSASSHSGHSALSKTISFVDEIGKMMHSFGDTKIPMPESARLIESIVKHQLMMILEEAELIASQRNSTTIGHEELLFLLKNDRDKLARLIRHLSFKDLKPKLTSNLDSDQIQKSVPSLSGPLLYSGGLTGIQQQQQQQHPQHPNTNSTDDDDSTNVDQLSSATTTFLKPNHLNHHHHNHHHCPTTKRVKLCHQFLSEIETPFGHCSSRSLLKVFSDDFVDRITLNRNRRLSAFTESLAIKDYYYYQACRSVSFIPNSSLSSSLSLSDLSGQTTTTSSKGNKFYEWLIVPYHQERNSGSGGGGAGGGRSALNHQIIKPNSLAVEILQFLAHETVAILVELALVIRDEQNQTESRTDESQADQWSAQLSSKFMEAQKKVAAAAQSLKPSGPADTSQTVEDILNKASVSMMTLQKSSQRSSDVGGPSVNGKPNRMNSSFSSSCSSWNSFSNRFNAHNSITPANIMEAMRRFERAVPRNFLARFSRSHSQMPNTTAICSRRQRILCL